MVRQDLSLKARNTCKAMYDSFECFFVFASSRDQLNSIRMRLVNFPVSVYFLGTICIYFRFSVIYCNHFLRDYSRGEYVKGNRYLLRGIYCIVLLLLLAIVPAPHSPVTIKAAATFSDSE